MNNLGALYHAARDYAEAEKVALHVREKSLGAHHLDKATTISNLGGVLADQSRFQEAEELYQRALKIRRKVFGDEHPDVKQSLRNVDKLYQRMGRG
ncbi:MAG: tetratricopeptide repeat protein [Cyanobacteria bacterium P01_F01_bin.116]